MASMQSIEMAHPRYDSANGTHKTRSIKLYTGIVGRAGTPSILNVVFAHPAPEELAQRNHYLTRTRVSTENKPLILRHCAGKKRF